MRDERTKRERLLADKARALGLDWYTGTAEQQQIVSGLYWAPVRPGLIEEPQEQAA